MKAVKKIDIAIAALEGAIKHHVAGEYIVSIILAGAANRIASDICTKKGIKTALQRIAHSSIKTDDKTVQTLFERVYNGMKHADRQPDGVISISEEESLALIKSSFINLRGLGVDKITDIHLLSQK